MKIHIDIKKDKDPNNNYKVLWDKLEIIEDLPIYLNEIKTYNYYDFEENVYSNSKKFSEELVLSLLAGDIILLKNTFDKNYMNNIKNIFKKKFDESDSTFYKMKEGCPNFYRNITSKLSNKYAFHQVKKTYYLFPWNKESESDIGDFYDQIYRRWRLLKYLSGFYKNAWESNTPKNGVIDRFQVAMYPSGSGEQQLHQDPYLFQKFFISIYLSKKNKDFLKGGIYLINKDKKIIDLENSIDIGDMSFGFGTIYHGVDKITPINIKDNNNSQRWWIGLYSTVSDYVDNRHTGKPISIKDTINN